MTQDTSNKAILALKAGGAAESDILKLASWPNIDWERIEGMAKKYGGDFLKELVESLFPTRT